MFVCNVYSVHILRIMHTCTRYIWRMNDFVHTHAHTCKTRSVHPSKWLCFYLCNVLTCETWLIEFINQNTHYSLFDLFLSHTPISSVFSLLLLNVVIYFDFPTRLVNALAKHTYMVHQHKYTHTHQWFRTVYTCFGCNNCHTKKNVNHHWIYYFFNLQPKSDYTPSNSWDEQQKWPFASLIQAKMNYMQTQNAKQNENKPLSEFFDSPVSRQCLNDIDLKKLRLQSASEIPLFSRVEKPFRHRFCKISRTKLLIQSVNHFIYTREANKEKNDKEKLTK